MILFGWCRPRIGAGFLILSHPGRFPSHTGSQYVSERRMPDWRRTERKSVGRSRTINESQLSCSSRRSRTVGSRVFAAR